jgi:hypothetical protein
VSQDNTFAQAQGIDKSAKRTKSKKIQEEYSMYEEEDKAIDDDELDDIMEEDHEEEESDDSDNRGKKKKKVHRDQDETPMEREVRNAQKEELKNLKTQMLTMKD